MPGPYWGGRDRQILGFACLVYTESSGPMKMKYPVSKKKKDALGIIAKVVL